MANNTEHKRTSAHAQLPPQLQEREYPNDRKPLKEIVMEGLFQYPKI